jgi:uncharacterized protein (UPF0332 family)
MALFNRHFVKEGIVPADMGRFYSRAFYHRLESDYGEIVDLHQEDVTADLATAEAFITRVKSELKLV